MDLASNIRFKDTCNSRISFHDDARRQTLVDLASIGTVLQNPNEQIRQATVKKIEVE